MSQLVSWSSDKLVVFVHQMDRKLFKVEKRILLINIAFNFTYFFVQSLVTWFNFRLCVHRKEEEVYFYNRIGKSSKVDQSKIFTGTECGSFFSSF